MCKMLTGFAALLVAGLLGGACGGHSGLKVWPGRCKRRGRGNGKPGWQLRLQRDRRREQHGPALSVRVESRRAEPVALSGGTGGTVECPPHPCFVLASCADRLVPNPDPCGCPICPPNLTPASRTTLAVRTAPRRVSFRPVPCWRARGEFESHGRCARQLGPRTIFVGMRACERGARKTA